MKKTLKIGIIGTGGIARGAHLNPGWLAVNDVEIVAACDANEAVARKLATDFKIPNVFTDFRDLLKMKEIDAVDICTPNKIHTPAVIGALKAGKHVLCEKPIALNAGEAQALLAARAKSGKLVAEAFMVRFHPQWRRAHELAHSGAIGGLRAIQTFFAYHLLDPTNIRNKPPGGGALYDIGCYAVLTARYIFEAEPLRVFAVIDRDPAMGTDRLVSGVAEFPGGRQLSFVCATQTSAHQRVTIAGDKGRIEVAIPFNAPVDRPTRITIDSGADLFGGGARVEEFPVCDQYTLQGDAFSRAVRGEAPLAYSIEDAIANMRVIDAMFASAQNGRWENF